MILAENIKNSPHRRALAAWLFCVACLPEKGDKTICA